MEQIMLVMCEHSNIDLSNTDLGNVTNLSTSAGQHSPVLNFHGLSISQGRGGGRGSVTSSMHSGAHSRELHKSFPTFSIFKHFVACHSASLNLDICQEGMGYNNSQICVKQSDHLVVVELDICVQVASDNWITSYDRLPFCVKGQCIANCASGAGAIEDQMNI
jgi:hypothetical protein